MYYLYVKTHKETGLKYLGQTSAQDPKKYPGSGTRWTNHIKKYGNDVETEIIFESTNKEEIKEKGLYYSKLWNVVADNNWANIIPEDGTGGDTSNTPNYQKALKNKDYTIFKTAEHKQKMSDISKNLWQKKFASADFDHNAFKVMCSDRSKKMWDSRGFSKEDLEKRSAIQKEVIQRPGVIENISKKAKDRWLEKSKTYEVTFPDGTITHIKCLRGWCKDNGFPYYKIYNTLRSNRPSKEGWLVKIV